MYAKLMLCIKHADASRTAEVLHLQVPVTHNTMPQFIETVQDLMNVHLQPVMEALGREVFDEADRAAVPKLPPAQATEKGDDATTT
jgi:hypothetical protein